MFGDFRFTENHNDSKETDDALVEDVLLGFGLELQYIIKFISRTARTFEGWMVSLTGLNWDVTFSGMELVSDIILFLFNFNFYIVYYHLKISTRKAFRQ